MDVTQKSHSKSVKALLRLYRKVLHNVNNEIVYLDELTYTTSRKHLSDLVNSLVEFETNIDSRKFNDKLDSCHKSLSLLQILDKTIVMVRDYPDNGQVYYDILTRYYYDNFKYTHDEIIEILEMSRSNYFRCFDKGIECFYMHLIPVMKSNEFTFKDEYFA
jgi:hypothetical protein